MIVRDTMDYDLGGRGSKLTENHEAKVSATSFKDKLFKVKIDLWSSFTRLPGRFRQHNKESCIEFSQTEFLANIGS